MELILLITPVIAMTDVIFQGNEALESDSMLDIMTFLQKHNEFYDSESESWINPSGSGSGTDWIECEIDRCNGLQNLCIENVLEANIFTWVFKYIFLLKIL